MSGIAEQAAKAAESSAVTACWRQWSALAGAGATTGIQPANAIIDPEALVLMSLAVRHRERRLQDLLLWWASTGASLMSVQRTRTLLEMYPESVRQDLGWFAALCLDAGDKRWQRLARRSDKPGAGARPGKGPDELQLLEPSTLLLRLRAGFGVGAKADLLAFLIGMAGLPGARATIETIAKAISYSVSSIGRAAGEMTLARFVHRSANGPAQYAADGGAWAGLLDLRNQYARESPLVIPPWRFWSQIYAFLARCLQWARDGSKSPVVQASRARDIVEDFGRALSWNLIDIPDTRLHAGERYLDAFCKLVAGVADWIDQNV